MAFLGLIPNFDDDVTLRMTPQDATKEATGRALALMGSVIGMVGGLMVLSVNPAFKREASGAWQSLPKTLQENKAATIILVGLGVAGLVAYNMKRTTTARYG